MTRHKQSLPWHVTGHAAGTFKLMDDYIAHRVAHGDFAASSAVVVRVVLANFARHLGDRDLSTIDEDDVAGWLTATGAGVNTTKSRLTKLRPFARWLVKRGVIAADFTGDIPNPRPVTGLPRCLPPHAVARLYEGCPDERGRLIVALMVQLGLRCAEVAAIRIGDIDRHRRLLTVRGKGARGEVSRAVPITDEAWNALAAYEATTQPRFSGALVASRQPPFGALTPATVSKLVQRWMSSAGLKTCTTTGSAPTRGSRRGPNPGDRCQSIQLGRQSSGKPRTGWTA